MLREEEREGGKMRAYPRSWLRKVLGVLRKVLLALLPENRFGDTVFSWVTLCFTMDVCLTATERGSITFFTPSRFQMKS